MGYVGNQTTTAFTSMDKQDITGNGGTSYTLSHAVANAQEIEVFVNNVRQEPAVAYTATGTTLTMTGAVASTDDFYVVYQGKAVQTVVPPDGSVTSAKLDTNIAVSGNLDVGTIRSANGTTAATIDSSGRIIKPNQPRFRARNSGITNYTSTGAMSWNTEDFDVGNNFSGSTFTCPIDGVYFFAFNLFRNSGHSASVDMVHNASSLGRAELVQTSAYETMGFSLIFPCSANDTVFLNLNAGQVHTNSALNFFTGYLVC